MPRIESNLERLVRQMTVEQALNPPFKAVCPECEAVEVTAKSGGMGSFEISCDQCWAVFYEGDVEMPDHLEDDGS